MGLPRALIAIAILFFCAPAEAFSEKRVALVIGINRYDNLPNDRNLKKAIGDARAIASALTRLGFEVQIVEDAGRSEINRQWARFLARLSPGDVAAFYYSGHGVELGGANYLIPRDVPNLGEAGEQLLRDESIGLNRMLDDLRDKRPRVSFLILDACRDNPFADNRGRSVGATRGLARAEPPKGSFVMYSAGTGQGALDRLGDDDTSPNSVYTRTLLPLLTAPGLSLSDIARKVKGGVRDLAGKVGHDQTPAYYDEIVGDFYPAGERSSIDEETPVEPQIGPQTKEAERAWEWVKDSKSLAALHAFRAQFGKTNPLLDVLAAQREAVLENERASLASQNQAAPVIPFNTLSEREKRNIEAIYDRAVEKAQAHEDTEAVRLYRIAAEKGHLAAMHNLAARLFLGKGATKNGQEALLWYRRAADGGYGDFMYVLASRYVKGVDVPIDEALAARWMVDALRHQSKYAINEMRDKFLEWSFSFREAFQAELRRQTTYSGPLNGMPNSEMKQTIALLTKH